MEPKPNGPEQEAARLHELRQEALALAEEVRASVDMMAPLVPRGQDVLKFTFQSFVDQEAEYSDELKRYVAKELGLDDFYSDGDGDFQSKVQQDYPSSDQKEPRKKRERIYEEYGDFVLEVNDEGEPLRIRRSKKNKKGEYELFKLKINDLSPSAREVLEDPSRRGEFFEKLAQVDKETRVSSDLGNEKIAELKGDPDNIQWDNVNIYYDDRRKGKELGSENVSIDDEDLRNAFIAYAKEYDIPNDKKSPAGKAAQSFLTRKKYRYKDTLVGEKINEEYADHQVEEKVVEPDEGSAASEGGTREQIRAAVDSMEPDVFLAQMGLKKHPEIGFDLVATISRLFDENSFYSQFRDLDQSKIVEEFRRRGYVDVPKESPSDVSGEPAPASSPASAPSEDSEGGGVEPSRSSSDPIKKEVSESLKGRVMTFLKNEYDRSVRLGIPFSLEDTLDYAITLDSDKRSEILWEAMSEGIDDFTPTSPSKSESGSNENEGGDVNDGQDFTGDDILEAGAARGDSGDDLFAEDIEVAAGIDDEEEDDLFGEDILAAAREVDEEEEERLFVEYLMGGPSPRESRRRPTFEAEERYEGLTAYMEARLRLLDAEAERGHSIKKFMGLWRHAGDVNLEAGFKKLGWIKGGEPQGVAGRLWRTALRGVNMRSTILGLSVGMTSLLGAGGFVGYGLARGLRMASSFATGMEAGKNVSFKPKFENEAAQDAFAVDVFKKDELTEEDQDIISQMGEEDIAELLRIYEGGNVFRGNKVDLRNPFYAAVIRRMEALHEQEHDYSRDIDLGVDDERSERVRANYDQLRGYFKQQFDELKKDQRWAGVKGAVLGLAVGSAFGYATEKILGEWLGHDAQALANEVIREEPGVADAVAKLGHSVEEYAVFKNNWEDEIAAINLMRNADGDVVLKDTSNFLGYGEVDALEHLARLRNIASWKGTEIGDRAQALLDKVDFDASDIKVDKYLSSTLGREIDQHVIPRVDPSETESFYSALEKKYGANWRDLKINPNDVLYYDSDSEGKIIFAGESGHPLNYDGGDPSELMAGKSEGSQRIAEIMKRAVDDMIAGEQDMIYYLSLDSYGDFKNAIKGEEGFNALVEYYRGKVGFMNEEMKNTLKEKHDLLFSAREGSKDYEDANNFFNFLFRRHASEMSSDAWYTKLLEERS